MAKKKAKETSAEEKGEETTSPVAEQDPANVTTESSEEVAPSVESEAELGEDKMLDSIITDKDENANQGKAKKSGERRAYGREFENIDPEIKEEAKKKVEGIDDVQELKDKRDEYNERTKNLVNEKKRIDEEFRTNRDRAQEYKNKRDQLNEQVKLIKKQRAEKFDKVNVLQEELKDAKKAEEEERHNNDKPQKGHINLRSVKTQIKELDNKIQTETLDLKEENEIVKKIQELENLKSELEGKTGSSAETKKIIKELSTFRNEISQFNEEIQTMSNESQNYHLLLQESYKELDAQRKELDQIRKELILTKAIADEFHNKYRDLSQKQKAFRSRGGNGSRMDHVQNQKKIKKQIMSDTLKSAEEKKKAGKKLSIFEARALFENAAHTDDKKE